MASTDRITITMTRTQALALVKIADIGLRVVEALALIQSTVAAEQAIIAVRAAATTRSKA